jgi:hypothetical protein
MKKSARASVPESSRSQQIERLTDAVNHLADEVRVVRDLLDEIREDFAWVTRNGIPGQPTIHTQLLRMPRDPLAPDANERLEFRRFKSGEPDYPELASDVLVELVSEIAEVVTGTGQEQVNFLLGALDDMRAKLVAAIKSPTVQPKGHKKPDIAESFSQPAPTSSLSPAPALPERPYDSKENDRDETPTLRTNQRRLF